jgi:hypothetical protein
MTIENLRAVASASPFQPFKIHLADGRNVMVRSPEFLFIPPGGRTVVLWQPDETLHLIDNPSNGRGRRR